MCRKGWPELFELSAPVAGAFKDYVIPGETFVELAFATATLTTSAGVADRFPRLSILNGDSESVFSVSSGTALAASLARTTAWSSDLGVAVGVASGEEALPFTGILLPPGFRLRFTAGNIQVADQLSSVSLYVWRHPSGDRFQSPNAIPFP